MFNNRFTIEILNYLRLTMTQYCRILSAFFICSVTLSSCLTDSIRISAELDEELNIAISQTTLNSPSYYILPNEKDLANIKQDSLNPLTPEKVALGNMLFFETGLAMDAMHESGLGTYSCGTCHIPEAGFRPGYSQGVADGGVGYGLNGEDRKMNYEDYDEAELDVQAARPLSLINVAFVENTFWNGQFGSTGVNSGDHDLWEGDEVLELNNLGFQGLETQNMEGLHVHRISIRKELLDEYGYTPLFDAAFPEVAGTDTLYNTVTYASLAISAYIRTILSNKAPFQSWLKGNSEAMTSDEKEGAILFFGKANCSRCHYEPNLGSSEFHALGVKDLIDVGGFDLREDDFRITGRGFYTKNPEDDYKFKVPGIYNIEEAGFYFHGSSHYSVRQVLDYKIAAESENFRITTDELSEKFEPLDLTEKEIRQLEVFLSNALKDPEMTRYYPDEILSNRCFPNADPQSINDLPRCN